jgi:NADPH-dependent 2,4-dienoyl-CoA reductase/sulfur reductase-like enzyme
MNDDAKRFALEPELVVIGAGPAGLSAAATAARHGVRAVLLDDQARPGGQAFRRCATSPDPLPHFARELNAVYADPLSLGIDYRPGHAAWAFDNNALQVSSPGGSYALRPWRTIIATGASEWVLPVEGWTLPGVITAGAAQTLVKTAGVVVGHRIAVAGTGPLLLQLTAQLLAVGANVVGVFDVASTVDWTLGASHTLWYPPLALQGLRLLAELARRSVRINSARVPICIFGNGRIEGLEIGRLDRSGGVGRFEIAADAVCLSYGLTPATELAVMRGCSLAFSRELGIWEVGRDRDMCTSVRGVYTAGDGARIGGARMAILEGRTAAISACRDLERISKDNAERLNACNRRELTRLVPVRRFLAHTFRPRPELLRFLSDKAMLCRCEEVKVGEVRAALRSGCRSLHEIRTLCRVGMGPCQGRFCTMTTLRLIAQETDRGLEELGPERPRPPVRPMRVNQLCDP